MNISDLTAFVEVAKTGSYSTAANNLYLTQPAVSKRVAKLEEQLGAKLVQRLGKKMILTAAGRTLLSHAEKLFVDIKSAEKAVKEISEGISGDLRLATSHHIGLHRLPSYLKHFADENPAVKLNLEFTDSEKSYDMVASGTVELAIVTLAPNAPAMFNEQSLWRDPLVFACAVDHPLAHLKTLSLHNLADHPCVLPGLDTYTGRIVKRLFEQHSLRLNASMATNYLETIKMLASVGFGWTVLPKTMLGDQLIELSVAEVNMSRSLGVVSLNQADLSKPAQRFIHTLQA